ncbi:MAG: MerC domain-containing protein [Acidobacteriota bacterium]|nr:MerC domain-containing protein [Acidobacteriota bacterium]
MRLKSRTINSNNLWDKTGITISWVCAAHCLAMPFIISFLPLLGISFLAHEGIEYVIIGFSIVIALITLLPAYFQQHRKIRTLLLYTSGICFVIFADMLFEESLSAKIIFVLIGACLVSSAHFINRKLCRNCEVCETGHRRLSQ